jgi:hypothetical protein
MFAVKDDPDTKDDDLKVSARVPCRSEHGRVADRDVRSAGRCGGLGRQVREAGACCCAALPAVTRVAYVACFIIACDHPCGHRCEHHRQLYANVLPPPQLHLRAHAHRYPAEALEDYARGPRHGQAARAAWPHQAGQLRPGRPPTVRASSQRSPLSPTRRRFDILKSLVTTNIAFDHVLATVHKMAEGYKASLAMKGESGWGHWRRPLRENVCARRPLTCTRARQLPRATRSGRTRQWTPTT